MDREQNLKLLTKMERKGRKRKIGAIIVSAIVLAVILYVATSDYEHKPVKKNVTIYLSDLTEILIKKNSTFQVSPGGSTVYREDLSYNSTMLGAFNSTSEITFYIFNKSELRAMNSSGIPSYIYTTGESSNGSIHVYLQSGVYYLEFQNADQSNSAEIHITKAFTVSFKV